VLYYHHIRIGGYNIADIK